MQAHNLFCELQNRAGTFFGFQTGVRSATFHVHLENARAFATCLSLSTGSGRLEYQRALHIICSGDLFQHRPTGKAANLFITHQCQSDAASRHQIKIVPCMQQRYCQCAVGFHVEDARTINAICLQPPWAFGD